MGGKKNGTHAQSKGSGRFSKGEGLRTVETYRDFRDMLTSPHFSSQTVQTLGRRMAVDRFKF